MDTNELVDFGTIKTARGDIEAAFCIFLSSKVCYPCITRIFNNVLLYASLFQENQCIAGQTGLHYLIFLWI